MNRQLWVGELPDGTELMVERWLDADGNEREVTAATKPAPEPDNWGVRVWGPPITLRRER